MREIVGNATQEFCTGLLVWHRFQWESSAQGTVVLPITQPIVGEALRLVSRHRTAGSGTYSIALLDDLDDDVLEGLGATLAINTLTSKSLYQAVGASWARPLLINRKASLRVTHTVAATYQGTVDLYVRSPACGAGSACNCG